MKHTPPTYLLLIGLAVLTLGAGFAAGMLCNRIASSGERVSAEEITPTGSLVEELQLSPVQAERMRAIWEQTRVSVQHSYRDAQRLQKMRDQAVAAILDERQKTQFEQIANDYAARFSHLSEARDKAFEQAVDQTRRILNDSQREKYERIITQRLHRSQAGDTAQRISLSELAQ